MKDLLKVVYTIRALFNFIKHHLLVSLNAVDISCTTKAFARLFQMVT